MPEPVRCLGCIFADEICRGVAAVAGGNRAMRRLEPAVEFLLHDMAVGAGRRIIDEIGPTLGIGEGINAEADGDTDNHSKQDALDHAQFHLCFRSPTMNDQSLAAERSIVECGSIGVLSFKCITALLHYSSLPLLPAAAQRSVELHHRIELPSPRAGQRQLLIEQLLVGYQNL